LETDIVRRGLKQKTFINTTIIDVIIFTYSKIN